MDMTREDFDEYRTRSIGVSQPDSAGDMGDDKSSIVYDSIEEDAPFDFIEGGDEQQSPTVPLSPGDREFLRRMNESTIGLPGVNQFTIPLEQTALPQLVSPYQYTYQQPLENIDAESRCSVAEEGSSKQGQGDILRFSSGEEATAWGQKNTQSKIDTTIPQTVEEKKNVVRALLEAMRSVESAEDNEGMLKPFREERYSLERMEVECWNILGWCILRHTRGSLLASFDNLKVKRTSEIDDFETRMGYIIDIIRTQKTICKHILDAPYILSFVDDPVGCRNRVMANKALNKRKGEVMTAGKEALGGTPTPGTRGRPRKMETPGSAGSASNEPASSSAGPASSTRKKTRETPRSRAESNIPSGYVPAGTNTSMESPTPVSQSSLRGQRLHAQTGSLGDNDAAVRGEYGNMPTNPYDPNLPENTRAPQDMQFNSKPGPGARKPKMMGPPLTTPARITRARSRNAPSSKAKKRTQRESDDQDYAPTPPKKSNR